MDKTALYEYVEKLNEYIEKIRNSKISKEEMLQMLICDGLVNPETIEKIRNSKISKDELDEDNIIQYYNEYNSYFTKYDSIECPTYIDELPTPIDSFDDYISIVNSQPINFKETAESIDPNDFLNEYGELVNMYNYYIDKIYKSFMLPATMVEDILNNNKRD